VRKQSKPFLNIHRINVSPVNLPCDEKRAGGFFSERERESNIKLCSAFVTSHHLLSASFNIEESNEMVML
jgi:hypothetical protein